MTMRTRLTFFYAVLVSLSVGLAAWVGVQIGEAKAVGRATDLLSVFLIVIWLLALTLAYLVALWHTRRFESLVVQAEEVAFSPMQQEVLLEGEDEVASVAKSLNKLRLDLTRGEEARNQLVADVAHELRTPLAILRGQLESMQAGVSELNLENLLPMLDETTRMTRLVQDLQQLSLAKAGRLPLNREWVPFAGLMEEILCVLEPEAEAQGLWLVPHLEAEGEVYCDRVRIKQVLINLIGNAIRYTQRGGTVDVRMTVHEGTVRVDVTDDGPGIPPESLPYLFERFYRVEGSRNRQSGGMGIGLAIAKEYVDAHGGTLTVKSELGDGTTFAMVLPLFPLS